MKTITLTDEAYARLKDWKIDGTVTMLYWQAVSIINPYQSSGTKDYHAGSLVLESLLEYDLPAPLRRR